VAGWGAVVVPAGRSVSGNVARFAAAGPVGMYSAPFWPQAPSTTAQSARTRPAKRLLSRIGKSFMAKL